MSRLPGGSSVLQTSLAWTFCALFSVFAAAPAWSQEVTAAIKGLVTDPSGAPVADAKVTARDTERGSVFPTTSNGDGAYNLPRLPVGAYEIRVEKPGFETVVRSGILLQLNQTVQLDFPLTLGSFNQTLEITSAAPLLETEDTQLGTVIDARENTSLPLSTRNYVQLTLLATGAVTPNPAGFGGSKTSFQSERPYVNGNREQTNNFLLDGLDNNQVSDNLVAYAPSVDAIEEFNMITQNASAEFGNFMGGIISVSIKSGTNQLHGTAFEFLRNNVLNANSWENNWKGISRSLLRWNQFGGSMGGPVIKDKLFLFGDYQGSRYDTPASTSSTSVLTAAERSGNFSGITQALYNPNAVTNGVRTAFSGNQIPISMMSPAAAKILSSSLYPLPINNNLTNNLTYQAHSYTNGDQGDIRGDWNKSDNERFTVRYSQADITNPSTNSLPLIYGGFGIFRIHNGEISYTRTISPSLVNEFRAGVNYNFNNTGSTPGTASPASLGIPGVPINIIPGLVFSGGNASTIGSADNISLFADTVIQVSDTAIWTKGQHTIKFGAQVFRERLDTFYSGNNGAAGTITFNGQFTAGPTVAQKATSTAGLAEADFFLGLPSAVGVGTNGGTWGQRADILAAFAEDTWRVSKNFTLNYGLRWELHTPWVEVDNRETNFTPFGGQEIIAGTGSTYYNNSRALYNQYNGIFNFQPRLGFAYTPVQSMVIRGAYTLSSYLEGTGTNLRLTINPPFSVEKNADYTAQTYPSSTLDQGYLPIQSKTDPFAAATLRLWDPNFRPAVSQQWNFSVQKQFGASTVLQTAYVGQKNDHLVVAQPYLQKQLLPNGTVIPSPYLSGNPALQADLYATKGQISGTEADGNQEYDALQVTLQQRLSHGLSGQFGYTWSKCMTDSTGFYGGSTLASSASAYIQNLYDRKSEWGPCFNDLEHVVTAHFSYDLPVGRGRAFGKNMNRVADAAIGGWQLNSIISVHGGFPLTESGSDASGTNSRGARADCVSAPDILGTSVDATIANSPSVGGYRYYINNGNFTQPVAGTFGDCGVGTFRGPGFAETDLSVSKRFHITERQNLEFRSEWINAFNNVLLQAPTHSVSSASNGLITSSTLNRNIQFGMKYNF
ncbi:MAG TPA: carboxypeptidase regulatory-like domain-containing protein [Bryobacteraceae bacterium]|nr:carboxypeptidase regulatory-like domain-containing protein [Bryobacteraceae bacterium]